MLVVAWGSPGKSHGDGRNLPIAFGTSAITEVALAAICGKFVPIGRLCSCRTRLAHPLKWRRATSPVTLMQPTTLVPRPIHHAGWAHEKKVDGYRMVAHKNGNAGSSAGSKRLRAQPKGDVATPPMLMAFDLLELDGADQRKRPLRERRQALEHLLTGERLILPMRRLSPNGREAWQEVTRAGWEGLVAKDPEEGARSDGSR